MCEHGWKEQELLKKEGGSNFVYTWQIVLGGVNGDRHLPITVEKSCIVYAAALWGSTASGRA